jgi:hypothetical protein
MQAHGLEWLYRVFQEPRRLWRRYFLQDLPIIAQMAVGAMVARTAEAFNPANSLERQPLLSEASNLPAPSASAANMPSQPLT